MWLTFLPFVFSMSHIFCYFLSSSYLFIQNMLWNRCKMYMYKLLNHFMNKDCSLNITYALRMPSKNQTNCERCALCKNPTQPCNDFIGIMYKKKSDKRLVNPISKWDGGRLAPLSPCAQTCLYYKARPTCFS